MRIFDNIDQVPSSLGPVCLTIGNFDGVHLGHQALIGHLLESTRRHRGVSVAMTFEPHPVRFFRGEEHPAFRLTTPAQRAAHLGRLGIDVLLVLPFNAALAALTPQDFVDQLVLRRLAAKHVVVGYDFNFGRGRQGTPEILVQLGTERGFEAEAFGPFRLGEEPVSSSRIRHRIRAGAMDDAARLLGRRYAMAGTVVRGEARGRELGFPTANVLPGALVCPTAGIYVTHLVRGDTGERLPGVTNVGTRPTFADARGTLIETFVLDAPAGLDLYGLAVEIEFVQLLRAEERFDSIEALVQQMERDAGAARAIHTASQHGG